MSFRNERSLGEEHRLKNSLTLVRSVLESTEDAILVVDRQGKIMECNRTFTEIWKVPPEILESKSGRKALAFAMGQLKNPEAFRAKVNELHAHPEAESFDIIEFLDGRVVERYSRPQQIEGAIVGRVWSFRDVTERERTKEKVQRYAERFRALADSSQLLAGARLDLPATLNRAIRKVVELLGDGCIIRLISKDGQRLEAAAYHHRNPEALALIRTLLENSFTPLGAGLTGSVAMNGEAVFVPVVTRDFARETLPGAYWPYLDRFPIHSWIFIPMRAGRRIIGVATLFREMTVASYTEEDKTLAVDLIDRAALAIDNAELYAQAQKAIQIRDDFMAIASHELKTPLTPLKMQFRLLLRILKTGILDGVAKGAELRSLLESSEVQLSHLTRLIDDLLEGSRVLGGRMPLRRENVELSELVSQVLRKFSDQASSVGCEIRFLREGVVTGFWDPVRIEEVVVNLLMNAMKYGAGKPIEIRVSSHGNAAEFSIRDFGIGIAREDQVRIFKRFERAVSYKNFGGMGLGLYISLEIVSAHGGTISVKSEPGAGATFSVSIPLRQ